MKKEKISIENRGLGAVPNPLDIRDISIASVQAPVKLPKKYKTDISKLKRRDQKQKGSCVGQAGAGLLDFFNLCETQNLADASARAIYALCKARDGYPGEGTYPRVLAKVLTEIGGPTVKVIKDDPSIPEPEYSRIKETDELLADAYPFRVDTNYAWVPTDVESLKQAVYQNKVILASLDVGKDYSDGRMTAENSRGRHYILIYGFEVKSNGDTKFLFLNSWSEDWGKDGTGYILFSEMAGHIYDVLAFLDIPNAVLEQAKVAYKFTLTLKKGSVGPEVTELQKRLSVEIAKDGLPCYRAGYFDNTFGPETEKAVQRYQTVKNIVSSGTPETTGYGQLGPKTRNVLNGSQPVRLALYPKVQEMRDKLVNIMAIIGKPIVITDEYRTNAEQDALYAKGRTAPGSIVTNAKGGESLHNYRVAFDVAYKAGNGISYEGDFHLIGAIGKILGLEWGGDWTSFVDRPHFQYTAGYSLSDFKGGKIDEGKFGVISKASEEGDIIKDNQNTTMSIWHRIKSFLINWASIIGTSLVGAVVAAIFSPEGMSIVAQWIANVPGQLIGLGIGAPIAVLVGLIISEVWKDILNKRKIANASRSDISAASVYRAKDLELY